MNSFFLITFILHSFFITSYYIHDTIEEIIPKYIIFEIRDFNSFKIFKYVPLCEENSNFTKSINFQIEVSPTAYLYLYDNFSHIEQNEYGYFINSLEEKIMVIDHDYGFIFPNLTCEKEYYFIISVTSADPYYLSSIVQFSIIDELKDKINLIPSLSDFFMIYQNNPPKTLFYSHNETKYASLFFSYKSNVQILKNDKIIYNKTENENSILEIIEFEKNQNYTIYFDGKGFPLINIQLFNEPKIFKHDFENGPIFLFNTKYYFEINISNFEFNEIILFKFYSTGASTYTFQYQYKKNFKGNNFIDLGNYEGQNYITIKKEVNDSSLIIYIEFQDLDFALLTLIQNKIEEINSEYSKEIYGPKYFYIDYFKINNINSIGIGASESFYLFEEYKSSPTSISSSGYQNYYITKTNNYDTQSFKSAIIYFNSSIEILFEIKKYNFSIFLTNLFVLVPDDEFFQLCQGENTLNELYFFTQVNSRDIGNELFTPVFGSFDSYFIKEEDIKVLQDFDFDKIKESNFFQTYNKTGYLKIKCNEPSMLRHSILDFDYDNNLSSGHKYYINNNYIKGVNYTFDISLINKNLQMKITIFGLYPKESINLIFNKNTYALNNTPFEISFLYEKYSLDLFYFEVGEEIQNLLLAEIIVGLPPEDINKIFKQIDFIDSLGSLTIKEKEGIIIKVPYNFDKDLYDYSMIFPRGNYIHAYSYSFYADISYDKLEYISVYKAFNNGISPIIPLFKVNPYNTIKNDSLDTNKFFYITIYNYYDEKQFYIKKPMLYSDIKFNKMNILPKLNENNKQFYYQIKIPESEGNYNSLLVQTIKTNFSLIISFSKNNIEYPYINIHHKYEHYFNIPFDRRDKKNCSFLNYYDVDNAPGYINLVETNDHIYPDIHPIFKLNLTVNQIKDKNKLNIKLNSVSYIFYPNSIKYYLIFNAENDINILYSILTGQKQPNKDSHQFMVVLEDDDWSKEIYEKEIDVKIDLIENDKNIVYFFPVNKKSNLVENLFTTNSEFVYDNLSFVERNKYAIILSVIIILILIITTIVVIYFFLKYRKSNRELDDREELEKELNTV